MKPSASSSRARANVPVSMAWRPPAVTTPMSVDFASTSSPATRTVVVSGPTWPAARVPGESGVERLQDAGPGQRVGNLRGGGTVRGDRERVGRLEVERVGDVDNYFPGEVVALRGGGGGGRAVG